jgi:Bacterial protein of unknown function (DUF937)
MNIVDILKQQLGGEVAKQLGGMAGASEGDLSKILGAGLPGLLSGLGSLASSKEGAGKIADAIGGLDSSLFGNLAGMLGGAVASKGGSMLGNLFGASIVDNLAGAISKYTGVNAGIVKMVLGYLTPMILGAVGKSFGGGKIDGSSVSRLFAEQKSNIASSLPSGFSLNSIPGFNTLASSGSTPRAPAPQTATPSGGLGKLLFPIVVVAALAGLYYYWSNAQKAAQRAAENAATVVKDAADEMTSKAGDMATKAIDGSEKMLKDAVENLPNLPGVDLDTIKGQFTSMFDGMTGKLGSVTDAAGAEQILPDLKGYASKLDGLSTTVSGLPTEGKSMIVDLIKSQMDKLNPILEKLTGIPGIGETVLQVIEQIKDKLKLLAG